MERKRARYKGPTIAWNNKEELISKKTYIFLTDEGEVKKTDREIQSYEKDDSEQSCIFDPVFTVDSSSSNSGESSSNEWVNCDDIDEADEEKAQPTAMSVMQMPKFILADFIPVKKNTCFGPPENESLRYHQSSNTLPAYENEESKESILSKYQSENLSQTNKSLITNGEGNCCVSNSFRNKLHVYKSRIEPYFDEKLLIGNPQTLLSNISKIYIDDYSELTSLAGYISESESSVYSEDSNKRVIKSILKRGGKNQMGNNPKKRVRFDLDLRSIDDLSTDIGQFPMDNKVKAIDKKIDNEMKMEAKLTDLNSHYKYCEDPSKEQIVENNLEIYREQCNSRNYFTNKDCFPMLKHDVKMIKNPETHESKEISFDSLAIGELLEGRCNLQKATSGFLEKKRINNEISDTGRRLNSENTHTPLKDSVSYTSIGVQSDQLETDSESSICSKYSNMSEPLGKEGLNESGLKPNEFKKIQTGNQPLITEGEYSSFIKDLVSGSGDKLANFLISLSSEISSKSGEEKVANALMTVGFVRDKNESHEVLNTTQNKTLSDNVKLEDSSADSNNRKKDIGSVKKINRNGLNSNKRNGRNLFVNNRRSMSEVNIHELKTKKPCYKSYTEKRFHSSRVDQLYIKKTNDDCMLRSISKNNPNANGDVMGRLCEIMTELKQNVDKICRKESTIRIENAQIWLKENQVEKNMSGDRPREAIISQKTKETYSQTIETIGLHVADHIQGKAVGKTEILIVSNSQNEEINIKVNDKSTKNRFIVSPIDSKEQKKTIEELNEIEERKRFFEENTHLPFHIVFNEKTHLPTLKKGNYEVEIFEKIDGQVMDDTNFKNFMKKLTGNLNATKLNSLHSYDKPRNIERSSHSSKSSSSGNSTQDKPVTNLITTFLNRLFKLRINVPVKNSNQKLVSSQNWAGADQVSTLKPFVPDSKKEKNLTELGMKNPINDGLTGSDDIHSFKLGHISSSCVERERDMYEYSSWPDVIKTKYPNGMIHFGPLALMPEPTYGSYERQCLKLESCPCPKTGGCCQYIYNKHMKHMVKASLSRTQDQHPEAQLSLEEFSETEQEFYHQWSEMGKT